MIRLAVRAAITIKFRDIILNEKALVPKQFGQSAFFLGILIIKD